MNNRNLRKAHKILGLSIALWLMLMCVTGIALQLTQILKLDDRYLHHKVWYNLTDTPQPTIYGFKNSPWLQIEHNVYHGQHQFPIDGRLESLSCAVQWCALKTPSQWFVVDQKGQLIDQVSWPKEAVLLGVNNTGPVISIHNNKQQYDWFLDPTTSQLDTLPLRMPEQAERIDAPSSIKSTGVSIEKVILNLHNANYLGKIGAWLNVLLSILTLGLCWSGLLIWWRRLR